MYIRFRTNNNRVIAKCKNKPINVEEREFTNLNGDFAIAEYNGEIPQHDYLTVTGVQEKTDTWIEKETVEKTNEKGEIVYEEVEVEKSRTYLTCELIPQFLSEEIKAKQVKQARISELKRLLSETDYKAIKYAEGLISEEEYLPIKLQRQAYRDEINSLEI